MTPGDDGHPVIVFDAMCVLCSTNAQFVLRHDQRGHFRLTSMQGDLGSELYRRYSIDPANPETLIIVECGKVTRDSDAVIAIYGGLGWPWRALAIARVLPRWVRDPAYRWIARNRYRLFGRRTTCWLPTAEQATRVL